jgi:molybdopterin-guanine dinucleotide biosynthesis protein A
MGADKASLPWEGRTLLAHALGLIQPLCTEVSIVGSPDKFSGFGRVVEDRFVDRGPLAGIHAALRSSGEDLNLLLAVDMPFVEERFLEYLLAQAAASRAIVTVPRTLAGWQPLCAVYSREFADIAESALRLGRNKIDPLFADIDLRVIQENELRNYGFPTGMFRNLNTAEEFEQARRSE